MEVGARHDGPCDPLVQCEKNIVFKTKDFVLKNLLPSFDKNIGQPFEVNCWVILRNSHGSASKMNC